MTESEFTAMVARLEAETARSPQAYVIRVALLAMLGFGLIAILIGVGGGGVLLLIAAFVALVVTGGKWFLLILHSYKLFLLLAAPLWLLFYSCLKALLTRVAEPEGIELLKQDATRLFEALDDMRKRMNGPKVHRVLLVDSVNAAVVQRARFGLIGFARNYVLLGLPLLERLSEAEALAVVAHEYAHLAGSHGRFGAYIYRLRRSWGAIDQLSEQWRGVGGRALRALVAWYAPYFNAYTFVLARMNEYQADAASADLVGPSVVESALRRTAVTAPHHAEFLEQALQEAVDDPKPPRDLPLRWATASTPSADVERGWLEEALRRESALTDTHPSLRERLSALTGGTLGQVSVARSAQPSAAHIWLGESLDTLRTRLGDEWRERVTARWESRYAERQALQSRLAALRQLATPSAEEQVEAFYIRFQLSPDDELIPELSEFNQRTPRQPGSLFLEGRLRLMKGDATGIGILDNAMALDVDAIKPGCELIIAFLAEQNDPRSVDYAERWKTRHSWEMHRASELETIDEGHEVSSTTVEPEELEVLHALLREHEEVIARAWLARRILPIDPSFPTFLLVIEPTVTARLNGRGTRIVERLAHRDWEAHTLVAELSSLPKRLRLALRGLEDTELAFRHVLPGRRFLKLPLTDWVAVLLITAILSLPILHNPRFIVLAPLLTLPNLFISVIALRRVKFKPLLRYIYCLLVFPAFLLFMVASIGLCQRLLPHIVREAGTSSEAAFLVSAVLPGFLCWAWYRGFVALDRRTGADSQK